MVKKRKGNNKVVLIVIVLLALLLAGFYFFGSSLTGNAVGGEIFRKSDTRISRPNFESIGDSASLSFNKEFANDSEISLNIERPIFGLSADVDADLFDSNSFVRIVLTDKSGNEYLVYESYPLIEDYSIKLKKVCDETCALDGVLPVSLKVYTQDASVKISKIYYANSFSDIKNKIKNKSVKDYNKELRKLQEKYKINQMNANMKKEGKGWVAGETGVSNLTYAEKKNLFGTTEDGTVQGTFSLQGFEYYKSGIFDFAVKGKSSGSGGKASPIVSAPNVPTSFNNVYGSAPSSTQIILPERYDWRAAHGENWNSPVKHQGGCGSCWAFGTLASAEANINSYYNQHINIDLSEQELVSCLADGSSCSAGGWPSHAMAYVKNTGIADEACFPYTATLNICSKCSDYQNRLWKIAGYGTILSDDSSLKKAIVEKGSINFGVIGSPWAGHDVSAVGYESTPTGTVWIVKNSYGLGWGDQGYGKITVPLDSRKYLYAIDGKPYPVSNPNLYQIKCNNNDNDSYCNWGVSITKPGSCPGSCFSDKKDLDDSNSSIGTFQAASVSADLKSTCREYSPSVVCELNTTCPAEYSALKTSSICGYSGKTRKYWQYCVKQTNVCGQCPLNQELVSHTYCSSGQRCSNGACII